MTDITVFSRHNHCCCNGNGVNNPAYIGKNIPVSVASPAHIIFSPAIPPGTNWKILISNPRNSGGEGIGVDFYNDTVNGFYVSSNDTGTFDYEVSLF